MSPSFILDAPSGVPREQIQVAKLGDFNDPRYGDLSFNADHIERWAKNLARLPGGRAPIDVDHSPEKKGETEAAGWITRISLDAHGTPVADVEWTPLGDKAIRDKRYLFFSPTINDHWTDEQGVDHGETLVGGALTNRPFLNMSTVCLSRHLSINPEPEKKESDSRRSMELTADHLKILGVTDEAAQKKILEMASADGADAAKVFEAIQEAQPAPEPAAKPDAKTLDKLADAQGAKVLSKDEYAELKHGAEQGKTAMKKLQEQEFTLTFDKAVSDGKVASGQRATYQELYEESPEKTLKLLAAAPKMLNTEARGSGSSQQAPADATQAAEIEVNQQIKTLMAADPQLDYHTAFDRVINGQGLL